MKLLGGFFFQFYLLDSRQVKKYILELLIDSFQFYLLDSETPNAIDNTSLGDFLSILFIRFLPIDSRKRSSSPVGFQFYLLDSNGKEIPLPFYHSLSILFIRFFRQRS